PLVPDADLALSRLVADVLNPALGPDHGVIAPGIGGVMTLLVGDEHSIVEPQKNVVKILDVNNWAQAALRKRRPVVIRPAGIPTRLRVAAMLDLVVKRQLSHRNDLLRQPAAK